MQQPVQPGYAPAYVAPASPPLCALFFGTPLRCLLMVITQQAAQSLAALNRPVAAGVCPAREQQDIALPLVIPFGMEMFNIFAQRSPQRALAKEDHLAEALLLHRPDPALRMGIQVRAARRQHQRLDPA